MRVYYFVIHNADGEGVATEEVVRFPCMTEAQALEAHEYFELFVDPNIIGRYTYTIEEGWL